MEANLNQFQEQQTPDTLALVLSDYNEVSTQVALSENVSEGKTYNNIIFLHIF